MSLFKAPILSTAVLAPDIFRLRIEASPEFVDGISPGRFVMLGLSGPSLDPLLLRPFGISAWGKNWFEVMIKVVGRGTRLLSQCRPGEELNVHGPLGNGYPAVAPTERPLLVAGGMGIASLASLLHCMPAAEAGDWKLLYGAATAEQLIAISQLGAHKNLDCATVTDDGSSGRQGLVTELLRQELEHFSKRLVLACGPEPMLRSVVAILREFKTPGYVSLEKRMACGFGVCLGCVQKVIGQSGPVYQKVCNQGPVFPAQEVEFNG